MGVVQNECRACECNDNPPPNGEHTTSFMHGFSTGALLSRVKIDILVAHFCEVHKMQFIELYKQVMQFEAEHVQKGGEG